MTKNEKGAPESAPTENQNKNRHFQSQYQTVYQLLLECPKTMLQVSIESGILRANICRYISEMREKGLVQVVRKGLCPFTKFRAGFYSTDKILFITPNASQLILF